MKKSLGIIGCGSIVQQVYMHILSKRNDVSADYVFDINPDAAKLVADKLKAVVCTFDELAEKADIILIATPPHTHFDLLSKCTQQGKIVICEKPYLFDLQHHEYIYQKAKEVNAEVFVAHFRRILPATYFAKQIYNSQVLGQIKEIQLFEGGRFTYKTQSGYETQNSYGGVLLDTGSHIIDQALYITGLDKADFSINNIQIQRDKQEPAHEVKASFEIFCNNRVIPVSLFLSRKQALSNKINVFAAGGIIEVPSGLSNRVRISKPDTEAFVASATYEIETYFQAFHMQLDQMLNPQNNDIFSASRFSNLTHILQKLLQA